MASSASRLVLDSVLRVLQPLVRLLLRHGVTYPAFAQACKQVFLQAAQAELARTGTPATDSALTLLCGVHRRDVRSLTRGEGAAGIREAAAPHAELGLAGEVVARWMSHPDWLDRRGRARVLPRGGEPGSFDALVASVSSDVRPRAMLDQLQRLGVVREDEAGIHLHGQGLAPRRGLAEMAALLADNLHDHAAAAAANLAGEANFLEQAMYVDQLSPESVALLRDTARQAWLAAFKRVMAQAQARFDADAQLPDAAQRKQRARFGVYFYAQPQDK
jgi:hypothetical protein